MFHFLKRKKKQQNGILYSMANGQSVAIEEVPDEVFSSKMMGEGIAVLPDEGKIYSPCHGRVTMVIENSKHAVGIECDDGMKFLIHIGLDTVSLLGEGFEAHVGANDRVEPGDLLISYDKELLNQKGISDVTMLVLVEPGDHEVIRFYPNQKVRIKESPLVEYK